MQISKIKSIQGNGTWESQHGTMYSFEVEMEDGTVMKANAKSEQPPYKVGDEVEYHIRKNDPQHGKSGTIKKHDPNRPQSNGSRRSSGDNSKIIRQTCIKAAAHFYEQRGATEADVITFAQKMAHYCETGENPYENG